MMNPPDYKHIAKAQGPRKAFGRAVLRARIGFGMSQSDLTKETGISTTDVARAEVGQLEGVPKLRCLGEYLGIEASDLAEVAA